MALTYKEAEEFISALLAIRNGATDAVASTAVSVFPQLNEDSSLISAGTRINWNGNIKRAAVDLWDTAENNPDNAPSLWEDIDYREGYRNIPETISATAAFANGERGWWDGKLYESVLDNNVWTPAAHAAGWVLVE